MQLRDGGGAFCIDVNHSRSAVVKTDKILCSLRFSNNDSSIFS